MRDFNIVSLLSIFYFVIKRMAETTTPFSSLNSHNNEENIIYDFGAIIAVKEIGSGGYGIVYKGYDKIHNINVAVKVCKLTTKKMKDNFIREAHICQRLRNVPMVLQTRRSFIYRGNGVIVSELMDIDLLEYITAKKRSQRKIKFLFREICNSVKNLHENSIAHMDIKPDNVLIKFGFINNKKVVSAVKLCDFGFSFDWKNDSEIKGSPLKIGKVGTKLYQPPEGSLPNEIYRVDKSDVWSLGITLFCMITGSFPFNERQPTRKVSKKLLATVIKDKDCLNLLCWIFQKNPLYRPSVDEILEHPWFSPSMAI